MSKNAIIQLDHLQYNVEEGKEYEIPKFSKSGEKLLKINEVLLVSDGSKTIVGKPFVEKAQVELELIETKKGEKILTRVYKAKSRYRRQKGYRKEVTTFKVKSIKF